MWTRSKGISLLLLMLLMSISCNPEIKKLEIVRIGNVRLDSINGGIISFRAEIEIRNPYASSATLKDIAFDLALTGPYIAYGKLTRSVELKSGAFAVIDVPLALECNKVTQLDLDALLKPEIQFRLEGSAKMERPFGPRTIPIHVQSKMKAPDLLRVKLRDRTVQSVLSVDAPDMRDFLSLIQNRKVSLLVTNPFQFSIPVQDLDYGISLNNSLLAEGQTDREFILTPGKNRLALSVKPHPLNTLEGLLGSIRNKQIPDLGLSAQLKIARQNRDLLIQLQYSPTL